MKTYESTNRAKWEIVKSAMLSVLILIVTAGTVIAGDRVFMKGDWWIIGGTGNQLSDFDMIRLSSNRSIDHFKSVTDTLNQKLMIDLAIGGDNVFPPETEYAGDTLDDYAMGTGYLKTFEDFVDTLKAHEVSVEAFNISLEVPAAYHTNGMRDALEVSITYARLIREYVRIAKAEYDSTQFWVFSAAHRGPTDLHPWEERELNSTAWDSMTALPNAIDVCYIGHIINVFPANMTDYKNELRKRIADTHDIANGKKVACQIFTYNNSSEPDSSVYKNIRNNYHRKWNTFRELVSFIKSVSDSVNSEDSSITWYQTHIVSSSGDYTLGNTAPPAGDIPWNNGGNYPARLWDDGHFWEWNHVVNQWEAEFVANFLAATGYTLPASAREISSSVTWAGQDTVVLLGDMEIKSGGTLTLGSSTVVKFRKGSDVHESGTDSDWAEIIVQSGGQLIATNTGTDTIRFQKDNLDSIGIWYGIRNLGGTVTMDQCLVRDADIGVVASSGTTTITDCTFMDCNQGIMALTPATISRNRIKDSSTGIYIDIGSSQSMTLQNNLIHDNSVQGLRIEDSPVLAINNNTIADNPTGIYLNNDDQMEVAILNTILASNSSYGLYESGSPSITLNYSDVWGSSTAFSGSTIGSWSNPPNDEDGCEGNIASDPEFVSSTNYHLSTSSPTSPCIDAGDPGMEDGDESRIDMGCYGGTAPRVNKPALLSITNFDPTLPDKISIDQNAPNPFNPETFITYALPSETETTLKVYNLLGQEVRTLVNGIMPAGYHRVVWDGRDDYGKKLSSGVYIYQFSAGNVVQTHKMLVLK